MDARILGAYPILCRVLEGTDFESDVELAAELAAAAEGVQQLKDALEQEEFAANALLRYVLCNTILPYEDHVATDLEADLAYLVQHLDIERVKSAFADQLVVPLRDAFEDVRYEIAASRICAEFFDVGTVELEKLIPGTRNNSDVFGQIGDVSYRFEVTLVHDNWLRGIDVGVSEEIESADIPTGYVVVLGRQIESATEATKAREMIEAVFELSRDNPNSDFTIGDIEFLWCGDEFRTKGSGLLIHRLSFEADPDMRIVSSPAVSRNVLNPNDAISRDSNNPDQVTEWEDPPGVVSGLNVPHDSATHQEIPLSTTIRTAAERKLRQCEPHCINVLILGQPLSMNDSSVIDAFYGATYIMGEVTENAEGIRTLGEASILRRPSKPFVNETQSEHPEQFVEHFRIMSGVILFRLDGSDRRFEWLPNPNASQPLSTEQWGRLAAIGRGRCRISS